MSPPASIGAPTTRMAWQALLIFLIALAVRLVDAGRPPVHHDELYHILAARSYWSDGTFRIWSGEYLRGAGFTALVAWSAGYFGDSLFAARLPSVIAGALLVAATFAWLYRTAGPGAAWAAAVLLALSSFALHISHFTRFYALHGLLFFLGAIALYAVVTRPMSRATFGWLALAAIALTAAYHLQVVTLIGVAALLLWATAYAAIRPDVRRLLASRRARLVTLGVAIPTLLATVVAAHLTGLIGALYAEYRWVALWNAGQQHNARFYIHHFGGDMPILFYLFPLAVVLAVARAPRPALFSLVVAIVPLVLHSFAGMKGERYVYYVYPFIFSIWAIAIAVLMPHVIAAATMLVARLWALLSRLPVQADGASVQPGLLARTLAGSIVAVAVLAALAGNRDFKTMWTVPLAAARAASGESWTRTELAREGRTQQMLRKVVDEGEVLVSSNELAALYFLGRFDVTVRASRLDEIKTRREFARDPRTGGPVIGTPASLRLIVACYPTGTLLVWNQDWGIAWAISPEMTSFIESSLQEVKLPGTLRVRAFRWQHGARADPECGRVYEALARPAAYGSAGLRAARGAR